MRRCSAWLTVGFLAAAATLAEAQQGGSSIRGRVVDPQQAVLPGVAIVVTHAESGTFRETVTAADGTYFVAGVVPGPYRVAAELQGFKKLTRDVRLAVGETLTLELALEVGTVAEAVTVTAEAAQVDLTSAQVGGIVSTAEIAELPSVNRNFTAFVGLLPGVVYNPSSSGSDSVTVNGQHASGVQYLMDGGSNNDDLRGGGAGAQARTAIEAIQEFQVVTSQFDAEYGAATAGVINAVTKQGTNAFRGSAFGYYTNANLTSKDFFVAQQNLEKPDTSKQQWGGTIGGPLVRDKAHFFFSFERLALHEGQSRVYTTRPDKSFSAVEETNSWDYLGRVDHQLNSNHNYSVRYLWDHQPNYNQVIGNGTKDTLYIEIDNDKTLVGTYNWVIGGTRLNTTRASYVYEKPDRGSALYQETKDYTKAAPTLQYLSFYDQTGNQQADVRTMVVYGLDNTFSWFIPGRGGSHDVKFGAQYQLGEHLREDQRSTQGVFTFATDRDFNRADPSTYPERLTIRVPGKLRLLSRTHSIGLYGQDKWQPTPNLTLSLGLRYDLHISPIDNRWNPLFSDPSAYPIDKNNIQPRAGFAYNMGGRAVVRGGYGMFYEKQWIERFEPYGVNAVFRDSFEAQFPVDRADPGPSNGRLPTDPLLVNGPVLNRALITQLFPPGSLARNTGTVFLDTPDRILGSQHQVSIGYERQFLQQLSFAADYVHMWNRNRPITYNLNPGLRESTSRTARITRVDFLGIANQLGLSPFATNVFIREFIAEFEYDGLNVQVEKRFSNYWGARLSYALGYGRGNSDGSHTATNDFQVLQARNLELNEGPTNLDRRHVVTLSGRVQAPWIPGLTASAIARFMSGTPFTIHDSTFDLNRNGILVDPLPSGTYSGTGANAITVENKGGRNGAYGPGFAQLDLRVVYRVRPRQGRAVDFYTEVFNATNRANFNNPTGDRRSGSFLIPTALRGGGFPRQFQVGVRLGF
ncbi:MAG: TonB-dependent receptor [Acidobacteria bacterium]|nr:TonB-dependent receptor [Acidobacteriota bacterium]